MMAGDSAAWRAADKKEWNHRVVGQGWQHQFTLNREP